MSRLSAFCEKLIEACWLAAIIMAPLFFNVYSSRTFEPDKTSLVRTLALVMVAAWLVIRAERLRVGTAERQGTEERALPAGRRVRDLADSWSRSNPLILPTLGLVAVYLISTIASVAPGISLLGSYTRMQGTIATFSYIVIFLLTASTMRTRAQVERAITTALITSFPVAFYGMIQHYFLDPLPWIGDVTTRVASNMGNSIFVGAYLITVIPLAIARVAGHAGRLSRELGPRGKTALYGGIVLSLLAFAAAWGLTFELGAKTLIEGKFQGTLTPEMLKASDTNFTVALIVTAAVVLAWWLAGLFLAKKRPGLFLLVGLYSFLVVLQTLTLFFTQSRGPLLGFLAGLFTLVLLYALARGARRLALGAMAAAAAGLLLLVLFNVAADTSMAGLRNLPYIGRLGQVFQTEEGTGKVRVLIWQGALKLVLPHSPLWSPTTGNDVLNPIRPLIGYGPETLFVAYNPFYPPELGHIESRTATPDRSHNETFDALVTTGLVGWIAENVLFLSVLYFGLKWLGLVNSVRERNVLIGLWYGGGLIMTLALGLTIGWHFVGVALPAGMLLGLFVYLVWFALLRSREVKLEQDSTRSLLLIVFLAAIVSHFVEIHFGIAIVSTRTMFWFLCGLLVVVGTRGAAEVSPVPTPAVAAAAEPREAGPASRARRRAKGRAPNLKAPSTRAAAPAAGSGTGGTLAVISTTPLITAAFIAGLIIATMGYDYINTTNVQANAGGTVAALGIIWNALTVKATTAGPQASYAMLWLFITTFLLLVGIAVAEWGWEARLPLQEWLMAGGLMAALTIAILASFLLYHTILLGAAGSGVFDALLAAFALFVVFLLVMVVVIAITLLMDERMPAPFVARPTNWLVAPALGLIALIFAFSTNVAIVQADMIYKEAAGTASGSTLTTSLQLYKQALALQPTQDYYLLFLGRAYQDLAQTTTDSKVRSDSLAGEQDALLAAQKLNPLNPDHTANLARMQQAWAGLLTDPAQQEEHYKQSFDYYQQAIRLSPYTTHLYDQYTLALIDYSSLLSGQHRAEAAAQARSEAQQTLDRSSKIDPTFCLTPAIQSQLDTDWRTAAADAFQALKLSSACDVFGQEGKSSAVQGLAQAADLAGAKGQGPEYAALLEQEAQARPSVELYTILLNYYSKAGQIDTAIKATDEAIHLIGDSDSATLKQYQDFRAQLVNLQQLIATANSNPNDAEAQRKLADYWLARGQPDRAVPVYEKVAALLPNDYSAHQHVTLLLARQNQLAEASRTLSQTLALAPASDRPLWERLGQVLDAAQRGDKASAMATLQELIKSTDSSNTLVLDSLKALADKLQAS